MERFIEATTLVEAHWEQVAWRLLRDPTCAIASTETLRMVLAGVHVDCSVQVALQQLDERDDGVAVPVRWRAVHHANLVPSFDGELRAEPSIAGTRLYLRGTYRVPLGSIGRFGDGLAGRRLARQSLRALLVQVASRLDIALADAPRPAYEVDVVEAERSELYIG